MPFNPIQILASALFRRRPECVPEGSRQLRLADGTELRVYINGPNDAPAIIFSHGWGLDSGEWRYARRDLAARFRIITWDMPGLGGSGRPGGNDWSLEKLARCLDAVIELAGDRPVVLVGHSIGGMIQLTYCRLFPEALGVRVRGLVIAQSSYTNPVKTAHRGRLLSAIQTPVLVPLCHLLIWASPLVQATNWLSYLVGSAQRSIDRSSLSGHENRADRDYLARYAYSSSPEVVARGLLAMFRYDATDVLRSIPVPVLVVAGDYDCLCVPAASAFMAKTIPHARLLTLRDAKHVGVFEYHAGFDAAVAAFAEECLGADKPEEHQEGGKSKVPGPFIES